MDYAEFYRQSIEEPEAFWHEQARLIDWQTPCSTVLDYSQPPFARWFVGGKTNLCHNAVDRWVAVQANQPALITVSTEAPDGEPCEKTYSFAELQAEVERTAAMMQTLGVQKGDRVLIYMPMVAEAMFAMLACARIGAIHSVVFGGFAANSLAFRIDDAKPVLIFSADAGSRGAGAMKDARINASLCIGVLSMECHAGTDCRFSSLLILHKTLRVKEHEIRKPR